MQKESMKNLFKKIYHILPFKKNIYLFIKYLPLPQTIYQHLYFYDSFEVKIENKKFKLQHYGFFIENEIFWKGLFKAWEKISMSIWVKLSKDSICIFDIGANTGIYGLVAKTQNPNAKVFAFEPVSRVYEKLKYNCMLNNYNINCQEYAVSDKDGIASIWDIPTNEHTLSVTVNKNTAGTGNLVEEIKIRTITLSTFIENYNISRIDLMKIDVESHEVELLKGMGKYLNRMRPTMLMEIVSEENAKKVEEILQGMEYLYFNIDEINPPRRVDHLSKSDHYNYLLCNEKIAIYLGLI